MVILTEVNHYHIYKGLLINTCISIIFRSTFTSPENVAVVDKLVKEIKCNNPLFEISDVAIVNIHG